MTYLANGRQLRNEFCGYQKFDTALTDDFKGDILSLYFVPLEECKSKCNNLVKCNNFEFCPSSNRCRLFHSTSDPGTAPSNAAQFFDCYANLKIDTCNKGTTTIHLFSQICPIVSFNIIEGKW